MKKRIVILLLSASLAYGVGFVHGQTKEAKFRIKLELGMAQWMKSVADKGDMSKLNEFLELTITAKTVMLERMMNNPLAHYSTARSAMSDETFNEKLPELKSQIAGFETQGIHKE